MTNQQRMNAEINAYHEAADPEELDDNYDTEIDTAHALLEKVSKTKGRNAKAEVLITNNSLGLRDILKCAFDDSIVFQLPSGAPPYTKPKKGSIKNQSLLDVTPKLVLLVTPKTNPLKRETAFIALMESLDPDDGEVLLAIKDGTFAGRYNGLTKKLVMTSFPDLIAK